MFAIAVIVGAVKGIRKTFEPDRGSPPRLPPPPAENPADKYREAAAAYSGKAPGSPLDETDRRQLTALGDAWIARVLSVPPGDMNDLVDAPRMADECLRRAPDAPKGTREGLMAGVRTSFAKIAGQMASLGWKRVSIHHARRLDDPDEALVYVRANLGDNLIGKFRWWVRRHGDRWLIYDIEDLDVGLRQSIIVGAALQGARGAVPPWVDAFSALTRRLLEGDEPQSLRAALDAFPRAGMPADVEAVLDVFEATASFAEGKPDAALKALDRAERLAPELPIALSTRAKVLNQLERRAEALKAARRHRELVGPDADSLSQAGFALIGLGRDEEAVKVLFEALDDNPAHTDSLCWLSDALPPARQGEIGERFAKIPKPADHFDPPANYFVMHNRRAALESLVEALRKLAPLDPRVESFAAKAKALPKEKVEPLFPAP